MSRLYPYDNNPRPVFRREQRVPGPFHVERRLRYEIIALPIVGTLAYLLMVSGWLS